MDQLYNDLLNELKCPKCNDYMLPPIKQCESGDSLCLKCTRTYPNCPICFKKFTDARNFKLESFATKMRIPCSNSSFGCVATFTILEKKSHDQMCLFRKLFSTYDCAFKNCSFKGNSGELLKHWLSKKSAAKPYLQKNVCHSKLKTDSFYVNFLTAFDENFWFKSKTENEKIFWAVQYIGEPSKASDYFYEIEVFKKGFSKSKTIFSDYCQSIELEDNDLFQENNCSYAPVNYLQKYVGIDQLLIYYLRVYKKESDEENQTIGLEGNNSRWRNQPQKSNRNSYQKNNKK